MMKFVRLLALAAALVPATAHADAPIDGWVEMSLRAVSSSRSVPDSDGVDGTGVGAGLETGFEWRAGRTEVQFDLRGEVFDYSQVDRPTRKTLVGGVTLTQHLSKAVALEVNVAHADNVVTLESQRTDQDAVRGGIILTRGSNELQVEAQYRKREYNEDPNDQAHGMRYNVDFLHRFGSYHWLSFDAAQESLEADNDFRSYDRTTLRATYSQPIAKRLRLRPQLEYRRWRYDARFVNGNTAGEQRRDWYVEPELAIAYGRPDRGVQFMAKAAYQFRTSNDDRYRDNQPVFEAEVGYRF